MDAAHITPTAPTEPDSKRLRWTQYDLLEIVLFLGAVVWLLPDTWLSKPLEGGFWFLFNNLGISQAMGPVVFYASGWVLLLCLMSRCFYVHFVVKSFPLRHKVFIGAISAFACLYLLDFFVSSVTSFEFQSRCWPYYVFISFFIVVLYLNSRQAIRLVQFVALLTGIQGMCAIFFYVTKIHQYYTPHFGNRTEGTFVSPNTLYPLCLLGVPLCTALAAVQPTLKMRFLFAAAALANFLALTFTYMRSGWLGLAGAVLYLFLTRHSVWSARPWQRVLMMALFVFILLSALFIRTRGEMIGTPMDRSTLGRFQIWHVSLRVIADHPWLGNGLASYQEAQSRQMTPELASFNPMNDEAKSLYLNMLAEFGWLGLSLLALIAWRYVLTIRAILRSTPSREIKAILIGTTAGIVAIGIAGLTDTPILTAYRAPATFTLMLSLGTIAAFARDSLPYGQETPLFNRRRLIRFGGILLSAILSCIVWTGMTAWRLVERATLQMDHYVYKLKALEGRHTASPIPPLFEEALLAVEDRNFYQHHGIDWDAIHYSLRKDMRLTAAPQGGSTLTMQAIRYTMLPYDKTPARKIAQMILAMRIEKRITKAEILRLYCDSVGFGLHSAGLSNAGAIYFAKQPADLSLAECAFLVSAIAHPPDDIHELTTSRVEQRKLSVLKKLEQMGDGAYEPQVLQNARSEHIHFAWENH